MTATEILKIISYKPLDTLSETSAIAIVLFHQLEKQTIIKYKRNVVIYYMTACHQKESNKPKHENLWFDPWNFQKEHFRFYFPDAKQLLLH